VRAPAQPVARIADGLEERLPRLRRRDIGSDYMIPKAQPAELADALRVQPGAAER